MVSLSSLVLSLTPTLREQRKLELVELVRGLSTPTTKPEAPKSDASAKTTGSKPDPIDLAEGAKLPSGEVKASQLEPQPELSELDTEPESTGKAGSSSQRAGRTNRPSERALPSTGLF